MFIQRKLYNKFGAKTEMAYGNYMVTKYMYNPLNLRLDSLVSSLQSNNYFSMGYRYDAKGNVTQLVSNYTWYSNNDPITQTFVYDSTDQLVSALGEVNQISMYSVNVSYGNWGKIGGYTTSMNGTDTFMYPTTNLTSTHFAPESSVNNGQTTNYDFGINGSLRRKENNEATEYYLFNAFNCMKAYSYNAERYGYYGYDASGERTYKMDINFLGVWTNELEEISDNWEMEKMMLYPNGYLNMNQNGEYTKHYYADALRIASKIGRGFDGNICDSVIEIENDYPNYLDDRMTDQNTIMMSELYETTQLASPQGSLHFVNPYPDLCNLQGNAQETELFYYHPDHLGSTGMVTDNLSNITAGYLYAPFGEILQEHLAVDNRIPKYAFNAKELDEENNMYYYSARYYAPPTFISRDPMFEKKPSITPYAYCGNNPVLFIDPTGEDEYEFDKFGKITWKAPNDVDIFYKVDNEGNKIDGTTLTLDKKVVTGQITLKGNDGTMVNYLKVTGDDEAKQIFEHLANNSSEAKTEYGLTRIGNQSSERNMIGVNAKHIDGKTAANKVLFQRGYTIREANHNHPTDDNTISEGDVYIAKMIQDKFPQAKFYNYTTSNSYTPYDKKSIGVNVKITLPACIIKATH